MKNTNLGKELSSKLQSILGDRALSLENIDNVNWTDSNSITYRNKISIAHRKCGWLWEALPGVSPSGYYSLGVISYCEKGNNFIFLGSYVYHHNTRKLIAWLDDKEELHTFQ
jgi:hypothetical protein